MSEGNQRQFSGPVSVFQERRLPERAIPAGYSALIGACKLFVPLPRTLFAIGERHRVLERGGWRILTPRHAPRPTLEGRSEEHTSELQSLMRISYAVFCLKKKKKTK